MKVLRIIVSTWVVILAVLSISNTVWGQTPTPALSKEQRIARNYELARKLYQGYVNLPKLGYVDAWEAEDFEPGRVTGFFDKTGKFKDPERRWREVTVARPGSWKDDDRDEYTGVLKVLPDFHAVTPFKAFCDETGCAVQMFVGGHDAVGKYYEDSEVVFFWSNEKGKISRIEVIDDWVNMQDLMGRIAGLPPEQMDYSKWGPAIRRILGKDKK